MGGAFFTVAGDTQSDLEPTGITIRLGSGCGINVWPEPPLYLCTFLSVQLKSCPNNPNDEPDGLARIAEKARIEVDINHCTYPNARMVINHELGHALGLAHHFYDMACNGYVGDYPFPGNISIMCNPGLESVQPHDGADIQEYYAQNQEKIFGHGQLIAPYPPSVT